MMGSLSIWHWLILAIIVAVLFGGKGKLSSVMGDAAKGIKAFKDGLKSEDEPPATAPKTTTTAAPAGTLPREVIERNEREAAVPRAEL